MLWPLLKNGFGCDVQSTLIIASDHQLFGKSDRGILKKKKQQLQLTSSWAKAQYSASDEDFATVGCFLDFQQTSDRVSQKETIASHRMISIETSTPNCVTKTRELYYSWHGKLRKVLSLGFPFKYPKYALGWLIMTHCWEGWKLTKLLVSMGYIWACESQV